VIFDGKPIQEISDEELANLVKERVKEGQNLDFKRALNLRKDSDKFDLLRDVTAFVNGGQGYIILGIEEGDERQAVNYVEVTDAESLRGSILDSCTANISEPISGFDVEVRAVNGKALVVIYIPQSDRVPHMVIYQDRTEFWIRDNDRKRVMSIGEIREAFTKQLAEGEVAEKEYDQLMKKYRSGMAPVLTTGTCGQAVSKAAADIFAEEVGNKKYFRVAATPYILSPSSIDVQSPAIKQIMLNPPGIDRTGYYNMAFGDGYRVAPVTNSVEGICRGDKEFEYLELLPNGHMECWIKLDEYFSHPK
jgi:hypothetical protein